jgi:hypothetical protein
MNEFRVKPMSNSYQLLTVNSQAEPLEAGSGYTDFAGLFPFPKSVRDNLRFYGLRQKLHYFTVLSIVSNAAKFIKIDDLRLEQNLSNWKMALIHNTLKSRGAFREKAQ